MLDSQGRSRNDSLNEDLTETRSWRMYGMEKLFEKWMAGEESELWKKYSVKFVLFLKLHQNIHEINGPRYSQQRLLCPLLVILCYPVTP